MKAADAWERWEIRDQQDRKRTASVPPATSATSPVIHTPVPLGKYAPVVHVFKGASFSDIPKLPHCDLTMLAPTSQFAQPRPPTVPPQVFTPQPGQTGSTQPSHQRNLHDANEAKASRKTDIEHRCQQMDPPIPPNILRHMDSFKAALQISQPMNDYAWSVLQPRLLAQLPAAQQAEANHVAHAITLSTKPADRRFQDVNSKEAKEAMDREWDDLQRPIRDKLSAIADNFINQDWDRGSALTLESSPKFAADLLTFVRRKFYEAEAHGVAPGSTDSAAIKPRLVLDNMKWVYDNKIKPLTEQYRKELFFCNGQDCESSARPYGFEGVVQHYGAKHTHAFSSGNVVVAWREAEWPEDTPFNPDPTSVQSFHPGHGATMPGYGSHFGGYSRAGTATPHMPTHMPQASPGPYYGGINYNGPFHPPHAPGVAISGFDYNQQFSTSAENYAYGMGPPGYAPQVGNNSYMPSPALGNPAIAPPPPPIPPPGHVTLETAPSSVDDAGHSTSLFDKQVSTVIEMSQDLWKTTGGIKDMPNSLRIYILLHRVISKFHVEFNHEPNLTHFLEAFSNHEISKSLKHAPGLSCKACQMGSSNQLTGAYYAKPVERKTYTALNLLSHFKTQHLAPVSYAVYGQQAHSLDWKEDMIELPSERFISGLIHAPGIDDEKLLMIATVFPSLFPRPLPKIGALESSGLASPPLSGTKDAPVVSEAAEDDPNKTGPSSLASAPKDSPAPLRPKEDEYDCLTSVPLSQITELPSSTKRQQPHRDSPPSERRPRVYDEPRYYVGALSNVSEIAAETDISFCLGTER